MNVNWTAIRWIQAAAILIALIVSATSARAADTPASLTSAAERAMKAGKYDEALSLYDKSRDLLPRNAEIPYNMAVAQYRKGDFEKAAELLNQAISLTNDSKLRARSIFNLGNAAYAQSQKAAQGQADPTQASEQVKNAKEKLKEALEQFKKAMDADPADQDARANAELSHKMLEQLEKLQQQQQQQQGDKSDKKDDQKQDQKQQQQQNQDGKKDQQQQDQEGAQSQPQTQPQDQPQSQPQSQPARESQAQQQNAEEQKDKEEQAQSQPAAAQSQPQSQPETQPDEPKNAKGAKQTMTKEEADRLLQAVRDKEKKRRAELAKREAAKHAPAVKDW